jgi:high-affinity iron transporter
MNWSNALPTFVITLREGVEAALVVGIVLAYLHKSNRETLDHWVYAGIGAGIVSSAIVGALMGWGLQKVETPVIKPLLQGGLCLIAIAMLSWMLLWMTQNAKSLKGEIENSLQQVLTQDDSQNNQGGWAVFFLILTAVLQEGFEIAIFINTQLQSGAIVVLGAIGGLVAATGLGMGLFRFGLKINLGTFFKGMGIFLLLIVAGLVVSALKQFDQAAFLGFSSLCFGNGDSCILGKTFWDFSQILPDNQFPGIVFNALLGYRDRIYILQAIAYLLFLGTASIIYFQSLKTPLLPTKSVKEKLSP